MNFKLLYQIRTGHEDIVSIIALDPLNRNDSCQGDSGGPLQISSSDQV